MLVSLVLPACHHFTRSLTFVRLLARLEPLSMTHLPSHAGSTRFLAADFELALAPEARYASSARALS